MFSAIGLRLTSLAARTVAPRTVELLSACIHTTPVVAFEKPSNWLRLNKKFYPPQAENEPPRPAVSVHTFALISADILIPLRFPPHQFICHEKKNIHYSPKKMWYVASFIRGMTIDEALRQLNFCDKKGAPFIKETILEAQKMAINDHNVEFKSNLWIGECKRTLIMSCGASRFGSFQPNRSAAKARSSKESVATRESASGAFTTDIATTTCASKRELRPRTTTASSGRQTNSSIRTSTICGSERFPTLCKHFLYFIKTLS